MKTTKKKVTILGTVTWVKSHNYLLLIIPVLNLTCTPCTLHSSLFLQAHTNVYFTETYFAFIYLTYKAAQQK
jgi:hypothetical protein